MSQLGLEGVGEGGVIIVTCQVDKCFWKTLREIHASCLKRWNVSQRQCRKIEGGGVTKNNVDDPSMNSFQTLSLRLGQSRVSERWGIFEYCGIKVNVASQWNTFGDCNMRFDCFDLSRSSTSAQTEISYIISSLITKLLWPKLYLVPFPNVIERMNEWKKYIARLKVYKCTLDLRT